LIRLKSGDTKTSQGHLVPLNQGLTQLLKSATRYDNCSLAFLNPLKLGSPDPRYKYRSTGHAFVRSCQMAGVLDVVLHDFRHTFVTNPRWSGINATTRMAITRHKTVSVFKRYTTVDASDLHAAMRRMEHATAEKTAIASPETIRDGYVIPGNSSRSRRSSAGRTTDS
jgi:integrase